MDTYGNGDYWYDPDEEFEERYKKQCALYQSKQIDATERKLMGILRSKSIKSYEIADEKIILTNDDAKLTFRLLNDDEMVELYGKADLEPLSDKEVELYGKTELEHYLHKKGYGKKLDNGNESFFIKEQYGPAVLFQDNEIRCIPVPVMNGLVGLESGIKYANNPYSMLPIESKKDHHELVGFLHLLHENTLFMQFLGKVHFTNHFHISYYKGFNIDP